jgi:hypothetical protein
MIAASDAFVFDAAELQRSTPVRTMKRYQPEAGRAITKQDEVFCQQSNLYRRTFRFHLVAECHRPPVTPQHLAGRLIWTHAGQQLVFFFGQHCITS